MRPAATSIELPRRARDLVARAVIEGHDQREPVIVAGEVLGLLQQEANVAIEIVAFADDAHAHIAVVQLGEVLADEAAQEPHQIGDLRGRTRPVLRAEGEDRQKGNAEVTRSTNGAAQRLDAAPMSFDARQAASGGPASVAIHDDGHMPRHLEGAAPLREKLGAASRSRRVAQTVMISFSLAASSLSTSAIVASVAF
jgi:hypothetical protein